MEIEALMFASFSCSACATRAQPVSPFLKVIAACRLERHSEGIFEHRH
jgi:hypothetical protein